MKTENLERSEQAPNENGAEGGPSSLDKAEVAASVKNQAQAAAFVDGDDSESCVPFEEDGEVGKEDPSLNDEDAKSKLGHQENLEQKTSSLVSTIDNILSETGNAAVDENESDSELSDDDEEENSYSREEDSGNEDEENLAGEEEDEDSEEDDLAEDEDEDSEEEDLAEEDEDSEEEDLAEDQDEDSEEEEDLAEEDEDSEEEDHAEDEDDNSEEEEELDEEALKKADQLLQEMDDNSEEEKELHEMNLKGEEHILQDMDDAEDPQLEEDDDEDLMEDEDSGEEERVEAILDKRIRKGKFQYKVKWASADESWENESILGNCKKMLEDFNQQWLEKKRNARGKNGRAGPGRGYTKEMLGIKPRATNPDSSDSDDSSDEEDAQPPKKITKKK